MSLQATEAGREGPYQIHSPEKCVTYCEIRSCLCFYPLQISGGRPPFLKLGALTQRGAAGGHVVTLGVCGIATLTSVLPSELGGWQVAAVDWPPSSEGSSLLAAAQK